MLLPVGRIDRCKLDRISAVQHDSIPDIDANVGDTGRVVCSNEEDEIAGFCICLGNRRADIVKPLRTEPPGIYKSAVCENPAHKAGAVKGRVGIGTAPHIRIAEILFRLGNQRRKLLVVQVQCSVNNEFLFRFYDVVNTFHSFAKKYSGVVGQIIGDEKTKLIKLVINYLCDTDNRFKNILGEFFLADTLKIDRKKFSSAEAYYEYLRSCRYETLNGEKVKSIDEMYIADFLFEHDINYIYENRYYLNNIIPGNNVSLENFIKETKEIAPDFYLTDYDLIWEHWAITDKTTETEKSGFTKRVGDASIYLHNRANKQKFWNDWRFNCKYKGYEDRFLKVKELLETCHKEFDFSINANQDDKETLRRLEVEKVLKSFLEKHGVKCVKLPREEIVRRVFEKAKDRFSMMMEQFVNKYQQTFFEREDEFINLADIVKNQKKKHF